MPVIGCRYRRLMRRLQKSLERLVQKAEQQSVTLILEPLTVYESNADHWTE
ncbi:MAG: hypothetical protein ACLR1V_12515 [Coprococcus sp.]